MLLIAKILFLLMAVFLGIPTAIKIVRNQRVPWMNSLLVAIGIVGFITCQWWIP